MNVKLHQLDLNLLRVFDALVLERNLTRAATAAHEPACGQQCLGTATLVAGGAVVRAYRPWHDTDANRLVATWAHTSGAEAPAGQPGAAACF